MCRSEAAKAVGSTGSAFRSLCHREEEFEVAYQAAAVQRRAGIVDDLRVELLFRAFDRERQGRDLHQALIMYDAMYREAHQRMRIENTGADGEPLEVRVVAGAAQRLAGKLADALDTDDHGAAGDASG